MNITDLSPCFCTNDVAACRDFYTRYFSADAIFDCGWYVNLRIGADGPTLQFMQPQEGMPVFAGTGVCVRTGSMQQIQYLIGQFGGRFSALAPPTDPMTLYQTLSSGRAIILHVGSGQMSSHVVVLTGMSFVPNGFGGVEPVLHINDPLSYFNQPVPYSALVSIWIEALVVN